MSIRKKTYPGDQTSGFTIGDIRGPDAHGQHLRITAVDFDGTDTHVQMRPIITPDHRVRYYGGRRGDEPAPNYDNEVLPDEIEAQ